MTDLSPLDALEQQSIYILREAFNRLDKVAVLWSLGKDSNVLVWLLRKAFFGHMPIPAVHVDTGKKFPEMYAFRDEYTKKWNINLIRGECPPIEEMDQSKPPAMRSAERKTAGLAKLHGEYGWTGVIAGIRRDEDGTRSKERVFSPRGPEGAWDVRNQPPELWDQFNVDVPAGCHLRIHPLLHWTELDVWRYIERENIPLVDLYFAKNGQRYRSLGDQDITSPIDSNATTIAEIIAELEATSAPERAGRAMDHEVEDAMERLRAEGYM